MESNNKVIYITQPYKNLESLFKSPIRPNEKEQYDTVLFVQLKMTSLMILPLQEALTDQNEIIKCFMEFTDINLHTASQWVEGIREEFQSKKLSSNEKMCTYINILNHQTNTLNLLPKSGFFCNRSEIAKNWLKSFVDHAGLQAEQMGLDFFNIWCQNLWRYLLTYHNDVFFIRKSETENDAADRIITELFEIVKNRSHLISKYLSK